MAIPPPRPERRQRSGDPTMPVHPAAAPPVYAPPEGERFDRGETRPQPPVAEPEPARDYAAEAAEFARRHLRTPETKEFFKTSEFGVWALTLVLLLIAGAASDAFDGGRVWLYVAIVSSAYIVSRGIAKAGTHRGRPERD